MNYILTLLGGIYFILFIARLITGPMPRIIELSNGKYDIEVRALIIPFLKHRGYSFRSRDIIFSNIFRDRKSRKLDSVETWIKEHNHKKNKSRVKKVGYYTPESEPIKNDLLTELRDKLSNANSLEEKESIAEQIVKESIKVF